MVAPVITTALQGAMAATSAFNMIGKTKDAANVAQQTLKSANDFTNTLASQNSLTDIVKMTRVEPETLIDQSCLHIEYLPDILQTTLNIFTGYYLQALSLLGTVNSTKVIRTLGALNPTAPDFFSMESYSEGAYKSALESYEFCLPVGTETRQAVMKIDPTVSIYNNSRGHIGCDSSQALAIGDTHQPEWQKVLMRIANLPYVTEIRQVDFE